jgi:hypothetical protein
MGRGCKYKLRVINLEYTTNKFVGGEFLQTILMLILTQPSP